MVTLHFHGEGAVPGLRFGQTAESQRTGCTILWTSPIDIIESEAVALVACTALEKLAMRAAIDV